jgi:triosephosphate isomerase
MSKRPKLISGNWKMYKSVADTKTFVEAIAKAAPKGIELLIFAQGPLLPTLAEDAKNLFAFGPQSIYWEEKGAFTGELSPALARELGCTYALSGHSERRQFFGETNETAARRALAAHAFGMRSVFCVGELLAERDAGRTFDVLRAQMAPLFAGAKSPPEGLSIAYEPVWAIGTGRTATAAQAQEAHAFLRGLLAGAWGADGAARVRILYGGSVKPDNARELMSQPDVDGVLVGGASLEPASFLAIAAAGKEC